MLDESNREFILKKEILEKEKKEISRSKDESLFKRSKEISLELEKILVEQKNIKTNLDSILSNSILIFITVLASKKFRIILSSSFIIFI